MFVIDKAVYELGYELNNRPEWIEIPLTGLLNGGRGLARFGLEQPQSVRIPYRS